MRANYLVLLIVIALSGNALAGNVLLVSGDYSTGQSVAGADGVIKSRIESLGHNVTLVSDEAVVQNHPLEALSVDPTIDLLIISSTSVSSLLGSEYRALTKPILVWEAYLYDDLAMTGSSASTDYGTLSNQLNIVVGGSHPITGGLNGTLNATNVADAYRWGVPGPASTISATLDDGSGRAALFSYDVGQTLTDGSSAAHRRVGFFMGDDSAQYWTSDTQILFDATIDWLLAAVVNTPPVVDAGEDISVAPGESVVLLGQVFDDGQTPHLATQWQVLSAPEGSVVTFDNSALPTTSAQFSDLGVYQLELSADDTEFFVSDVVTVTVSEVVVAPEILFVGGESSASEADAKVIQYLEATGYNLTYLDDNDSSSSSAQGFDAVLISSTTSSGRVGTKFTSVAVPVLTWEAWLYDDLKLVGDSANVDFGVVASQNYIEVLSGGALSAGLAGAVEISLSPDSYRFGIPNQNAVIAATILGDSSRATLFAYEAGQSLIDGSIAPAPRVALPFGDLTAASWTESARALLDSALEWAGVEEGAGSGDPINTPPSVSFAEEMIYTSVGLSIPLAGSVTDDGIAGPLTTTWSVVSEPSPGAVIVDNYGSPETNAVFNEVGIYRLELEAFDTEFLVEKTLTVNVAEQNDRQVLFVVGSVPLSNGDVKVLDYLHLNGFDVELVDDNVVSTSDASGKQLVIISSTTSSGRVGNKFTNVSIPIIVWEAWLFDDLALTGPLGSTDYGTTSDQTQILLDSTHPLSAGFSGLATTTKSPSLYRWGVPEPSAQIAASLAGDVSKATIFAYETGAQLANGSPAPARRVAMFMGDNSGLVWTPDGQSLFEAAIGWAMDIELADKVRILPLGDSITDGTGSSFSYRRYLWESLTGDGCRVDFTGTLNGPSVDSSVLFDRDFEGHRGYRTDQILNGLPGWLEGNTPDMVMIHLGTNDILQGANLDNAKEYYRSIIGELRGRAPNISIFLAKVIPGAQSLESSVLYWNSLVESLASEEDSAASPVQLVDQYTGYSNDLHNSDDIHPNDLGDQLIASRWYDGVRPHLTDYCLP